MRNEILFTKVLDEVFNMQMQGTEDIQAKIKEKYGEKAIEMIPTVEKILDIYCNHYDVVILPEEVVLTYDDALTIVTKFEKGESFKVVQAKNGINVEFEKIPEKSLFDAINMLAS